ncbi:hypothetical protein ACSQ67_014417 [Phaseolus vulgaris]
MGAMRLMSHMNGPLTRFSISCGRCLRHGDNTNIMYAHVADEIQWSPVKDETVVKVDVSHYFFSFRVTKGFDPEEE